MKNIEKYLSLLEGEVDGLLLTSRYSRYYGAEYEIAEGVAVVSRAGCRYFTDSRYIEAAQNGIKGFEVMMVDRAHPYHQLINDAIKDFNITKLGYEESYLTVEEFMGYQKSLKAELVPMNGPISRFRSVKEAWELEIMRQAQAIADKAFAEVLTKVRAGMTEKQLCAELIYCLLKNGGEGLSFDPIVVSGPNTSLPHGVPGERVLQEGDFIIIRNPKAKTMHVMLRISGDRIVHCSGWKYKFAEGREVWETFGGIRIDTIQNFFLDMLGVYPFHNFSHWWVVRILDAIDPEQYPLTEATKARVAHPGLNLDFTSSVRRYHNVKAGDSITYTLRIRNDQTRDVKEPHVLPVEITLPAGTQLQESGLDSLYTLQDGKLCRTVTVYPMQEQTLSVTVRVGDVPCGTAVQAEATVAGIPIAAQPNFVGERLTLEDACKLAKAESGTAAQVYETVLGKQVAIPTAEELLNALYERGPAKIWEDENLEAFKEKQLLHKIGSHPAEAMLVPGLWGGRALGEVSQYDRVLELRPEYLCPGDVVLAAKNLQAEGLDSEEILILGGGNVLRNGEKTETPDFDSLFAYDWFAVLRPCMGGN